ncbi:MAG TPA: glycoside hydrolase family 78 protein, partial [Tepidisphaeraceae bacterium]|nr:glycoside hydrolase family 78 protein [Tepidisphaeraceae bacterium]
RLSWRITDDRRGAMQSAYQIVVHAGQTPLWDSGKVDSSQSVHVEYNGLPLKSRMRCTWKVQTWNEAGEASPWSEPAIWEMGFLERSDWKAKWIGSPIVGGPYSIPPAPYLRKEFSLAKSIESARLYVTALGLYEFEINGQRVGENVLMPGRTEYRKRVPYHVYDVASHLHAGENACGAILGDGWYCGHLHSDPRQTYGDRPQLLAQLEITFADGSSQIIVSDNTWKSGEGPIRSSDMLMGEDYDARMEIPGWSMPSFNNNAWQSALLFDDPKIEIVAHRAPPMRKIQEIKPIKPPTLSANKRRHLFDLGQNMVGWVRLKFRNAPPGKTIDLRYVEMLDKDGKPYTTALRTARATDHYTTGGGPEETFEPRFTFHGFRYVEVRDYPGPLTADDLVGVVVHSDCEFTGEFECSDPMINQLQHNIVWSQKGNFLDIPTDCPQRDERLGWTGDAQVFIRTAGFNMDVANFFAKWLTDVADSQYEDGHIPSVVPHVTSIHHEGGPAWADAAVICPWWVYQTYGDTRIIENCWPTMTRFVGWMQNSYPDFIRPKPGAKWQGYGDWLSIGAITPPDLIGTAFFAYCANLMAKMARAVGKTAEAEKYTRLFEQVRAAWNARFVKKEGAAVEAAVANSVYEDMGVKASGDPAASRSVSISSPLSVQSQTAYVLALHFDLLPDGLQPQVFDALVRDIEAHDMHLSTGFVGTPYLNHVLTRFGRPDIAYALLNQKTFPSWLFPITHGATTMWERWDGWTPEKGFNDAGMNSYNHYAYGAVGEWMYSTIAGIDLDPEKPGYKHIVIRPNPGGGLTHASAKLDSIHGVIEVAWRLHDSQLQIDMTIPPNTTATIHLPTSNASAIIESGKPASQAAGLRFIRANETTAAYEAGAGRYAFQSTFSRRQ